MFGGAAAATEASVAAIKATRSAIKLERRIMPQFCVLSAIGCQAGSSAMRGGTSTHPAPMQPPKRLPPAAPGAVQFERKGGEAGGTVAMHRSLLPLSAGYVPPPLARIA